MTLSNFPQRIGLGRLGVGRRVAAAPARVLNLTLVTTAANETVTISRLTPTGGECVIEWGDSTTTTVTNGFTGAINKVYASAGTYSVVVSNADLITQVDFRNSKIRNFNTAQLAGNVVTHFFVSDILSSTINSADMVDWRPTSTWYCFLSSSTGTYTLNSAHMVDWQPNNWQLFGMAAGSYAISTAHMVDWRPTSAFQFRSMPAGTYNFNTAYTADWKVNDLRVFSLPTGSVTISSAADFAGWTSTTVALLSSNGLLTADVDRILQGFWNMFPSRTATGGVLQVHGTNQAPSGTFQAANPPTTGKEYAYELLNDSQNINPTKKWATVNFTA